MDETHIQCVQVCACKSMRVCVCVCGTKHILVPESAPGFFTANKLSGKSSAAIVVSVSGDSIWEIMERIDATFRGTDGARSDHTVTPAYLPANTER